MEQDDNKSHAEKICGNCDAFCECSMAGAEYNEVACPAFDDSAQSE